MRNKIPLFFILFISLTLIYGCVTAAAEESALDNINGPDEVFSSDFWNGGIASDFIPVPENGEVLYAQRKNNELIVHMRADAIDRFGYENDLSANWYVNIPLDVSMNDRISTWLHPTGWRIAIYDNRRSKNLRSLYGTEDYVYELRIKKITVPEGTFTQYPKAENSLGLSFVEYGTGIDELNGLLPEDFILPGYQAITRVWQDNCGLFIQLAATTQDLNEYYERLHNSSRLSPGDKGCYANANGDYFYFSSALLSDSEISELGLLCDDTDIPVLITIQAVRNEWLPSWWLDIKANG